MLNNNDDIAFSSPTTDAANLHQRLVESENLEIETPFNIAEAQRAVLRQRFEAYGFVFPTSNPVSIYMDGPGLPIARFAYKSLRYRHGNVGSDGEVFPALLCLKSRDSDLQRVSNELTARHPLAKLRRFKVTPPLIRKEMEVEWSLADGGIQIPFSKLPDPIVREICSSEICTRIPYSELKAMTVRPVMASDVTNREKTRLFFDPDNKTDFPFSPAPTAHMLKSGRFVCIEIAIDDCRFVDLQKIKDPNIIFAGSKTNFRGFRTTGQTTIFEPEYKADHSGKNITPAMIIDASVQVEYFARNWLVENYLAKQARKSKRKFKARVPDFLVPCPSKFACGVRPNIPPAEIQQFRKLAS